VGSRPDRSARLPEHAPARPGGRRGAPAGVPAVWAAGGSLPRGPPVPGRLLLVLREPGPVAHDLRGRGDRALGARRRGLLAGTSRPGARMGHHPAAAATGWGRRDRPGGALPEGVSDAPSALDVAEWAKDLGILLRGDGPAARGAVPSARERASRHEPRGDPPDVQDPGAGSRTGRSRVGA